MGRIKLNNKKTVAVFSLAISVLLWSYVMGDINPFATKQLLGVDVDISSLADENLVIASEIDQNVNVKISGRRSEISNIRRNDLSFSVDLSEYDEGTHSVDIDLNTSVSMKNVDIDYSPKTVEVEIEQIIKKPFAVELRTLGDFSKGMDSSRINMEAEDVVVTGLRSRVDSVVGAVASLDVSLIKGGESFELRIVPVDKSGNEVSEVELDRKTVSVSISDSEVKKAEVSLNLSGEIPEGYELLESKVLPAEVSFKELDKSQTVKKIETAKLDISSFTESVDLEVELEVPPGIELLSSPKVKVSLSIKKLEALKEEEEETIKKSLEYEASEIAILNLGENLEVENMEEISAQIALELSGLEERIESLTKQDLTLSVDFSEITESGEYPLEIAVDGVPDGVKAENINPDTITFKVLSIED